MMAEQHKPLGRPIIYGIFGFIGGILGGPIAFKLGLMDSETLAWSMPCFAAIGAAIGGWLRENRERNS